jgi:nucleotide-binding universal stress UspA family protein
MFKRVLLCYDGSDAGRRALKRGAELAILLRAQVHVLSIVPGGVTDPAVMAGVTGHPCLFDESGGHRKLLNQSLEWLKSRGVAAEGYLASGDTIGQIVAHAKRLAIDLIVLGHYPRPSGGFWWTGAQQRGSLADRVGCCVFVAVSADSDSVAEASGTSGAPGASEQSTR